MIPGKMVKGMGGAMDLVAGAKRVIVAMQHCDKKNNQKKILKKCTLPLTGIGCVDLIVTDMGVMEVTREGLVLIEHAPDLTPSQIQAETEAILILSPKLKPVKV
jgi:3-oxoacid CoA-transferase B subunit